MFTSPRLLKRNFACFVCATRSHYPPIHNLTLHRYTHRIIIARGVHRSTNCLLTTHNISFIKWAITTPDPKRQVYSDTYDGDDDVSGRGRRRDSPSLPPCGGDGGGCVLLGVNACICSLLINHLLNTDGDTYRLEVNRIYVTSCSTRICLGDGV